MTDTWQPIETAPKDETRILVANASEAATAEFCGRWVISPIASDEWGLIEINFTPTHWMPVAALPVQK